MARSGRIRETFPVSMYRALQQRTDNVEYDEVPIPNKPGAFVRMIRGYERPSARSLAGALGRATMYHAVEVYRARFNPSQERRQDQLIRFAQNHPGVRGIIGRAFRAPLYVQTRVDYDHEALRRVTGTDYDTLVSTTWRATVDLRPDQKTAFGERLTPERLTTAFQMGMKLLTGMTDEELASRTSITTTHDVNEKALFSKVETSRISQDDLESVGTATGTWAMRLVPQLGGAEQPGLGLTVGDSEPVPLQP